MNNTIQFEELDTEPGQMDIDSLNDSDAIVTAIEYHKTRLYEKTKFFNQTSQAKKDMAAGFREQLKEIKEELDFEVGQLDALHDKLKLINAKGV